MVCVLVVSGSYTDNLVVLVVKLMLLVGSGALLTGITNQWLVYQM
jgi:hypothetical protein